MDADGFTIVTRSKGRRGKVISSDNISANARSGNEDQIRVPPMRKDHWLRRHEKFKRQIKRTSLYETLVSKALEFQPHSVVCYGLGSLSIPRCGLQLALICSVCDSLASEGIPTIRVSFDPIHGVADKELLTVCEFTPLAASVLGKDVSKESRALFFMPHSERWMYADVIAARSTVLEKTLIAGNSFKEYVLLDSHGKHQDDILKLVRDERVLESALSLTVDEHDCDIDATTLFGAFNNTRIIRILPRPNCC